MTLNCIYIDSNPVDRLLFLQTLKHFPEISLKAEFSYAIHAKEYLNYNAVDFAFVYSDLPVYNGFEFVNQLKDHIEIVLLTKEPMDAIKSYEMGFIDCLLKPVGKDRLKCSIDRLIHKLKSTEIINQKKEQMIYFKCNFKSEKLEASSIRWVEAMGDYVKVVTSNKNYMILSTMKSFLIKLPKNQFVRIHKSYIVNLQKVINYTAKDVNADGRILPLSRKQKGVFKETFLNYQ
ncbi:MAG: LytTR family DNA-binding domain-containing protein [Bacteroidetes bacterium]|nr:LytTR family DNA-binding domain-containing protein [Bacteroidota bacterium]